MAAFVSKKGRSRVFSYLEPTRAPGQPTGFSAPILHIDFPMEYSSER